MYWNFIIHQISLNSCSHSRISELARPWVGRPVPSLVPFYLFFDFYWLGQYQVARSLINRSWHSYWRDVTLNSILSFSSLDFTYCRWRRWGWRRWWGITLLSRRCPWGWWVRSRRRIWQAWNHNRNEVLRVAGNPNTVLNEMWFFDHWSIRKNIRFHRNAFRAIRLLAYSRGLSESRIYPILWRTLLPLHASALLHWLLWVS